MKKDLKAILDMTKTPEGEIKLLEDAMDGSEIGDRWVEMVRRGVAGDASYKKLVGRPLVSALMEYTSGVMTPQVDNLKTVEDAPWGGTLITGEMKRGLSKWPKDYVVGESWEISGHPSYRNTFGIKYADQDVKVDIGILEEMFSTNLYGSANNERMHMPFLVKLLNSGGWEEYKGELATILSELDGRTEAEGWRKALKVQSSLIEIANRDYGVIHSSLSLLEEMVGGDYPEMVHLSELHRRMLARNLSVQVHPTSDFEGLKEGEHSKTEAWIIVGAEDGAGIYLGLKEGITKRVFGEIMSEGGDVTAFLNFVPVSAGDVFFIPSGTIHAIGAGVMLVEPQETSETTYRVYDYGRVNDEGKPRSLHMDQAMAVIDWDGLRGMTALSSYRRMPEMIPGPELDSAVVERLVDEDLFAASRIMAARGERYAVEDGHGMIGYTILDGAVEVRRESDGAFQGEFFKGQSFIVPAAAGSYEIKGNAGRSVLIETRQSNG